MKIKKISENAQYATFFTGLEGFISDSKGGVWVFGGAELMLLDLD